MQKTNPPWKEKVSEIFQTCQDELKRTTDIGKKMLTASRTNSNLHEAYEELGVLVACAIKSGELKWDNPRVKELLNTVQNCEHDLDEIEDEVNKIKFASGPVDVTTTKPQAASTKTSKEEVKEENKED